MNYNKAVIVGRVVQDPSLRTTPAGQPVATMSVASNRAYTDKSGAKQESTEFHNVVIWGKLAETASAHLTKGSLVLVEGRLQTRSYTDKQGSAHRVTEIIAESIQFGPKPSAAKPEPAPAAKPADDVSIVPLDDDEAAGHSMKPLFPDEDEDIGEHPF